MSTYRCEVLDPKLIDQVVPLIHQLGASPRCDHVGYLTWKYLNNPYMADPLICVVRHEGRVVGMRGVYGTSWVLPGVERPQMLPCTADTVIANEHRSGSLFAELTEFALARLVDRGFRHVINLGATPANHIASIVSLGWLKVGSYEPVVRSTRAVAAPGRTQASARTPSPFDPLVRRIKSSEWLGRTVRELRTARRNTFGESPFAHLDRRPDRKGRGKTPEVTAEPRPHTMARVAAQFAVPGRIHHVRDETYFAWRYGNPLARDRWSNGRVHRRFFFLHGRSGEGYAVLQGIPGRPDLRLIDWAGDEETFAVLLDTVMASIKPVRLGTWSATLPGAVRTHLAQSGFVPERGNLQARWQGLLIKSLNAGGAVPGDRQLFDINNWDLRMIQSDAIT